MTPHLPNVPLDGGVVEMVLFAVCVELGADRTLIGAVFDGRRFEDRGRHLDRRGELGPAVGAGSVGVNPVDSQMVTRIERFLTSFVRRQLSQADIDSRPPAHICESFEAFPRLWGLGRSS